MKATAAAISQQQYRNGEHILFNVSQNYHTYTYSIDLSIFVVVAVVVVFFYVYFIS